MRNIVKISLLATALFTLPFVCKKAYAQSRAGNPQVWEYKTITRWREATAGFGGAATWGSWSSYEDEATSQPLPGNLTQQLNRLGAEGWELVASEVFLSYFTDGTVQGQARHMLFKKAVR